MTIVPETNQLLRHASVAAWACRALAVAIPVLVLVSLGLGDAERAALAQIRLPPTHEMAVAQKLAAVILSLLPVLALAMSLLGLATCFAGFAKADWFGAAQPKALASSGQWLVLAGVLALLIPTPLSLVMSLNADPGSRALAITLSSQGFLQILFGSAFWSLGRLWSIARAMATENAAFV